ncbi:MAG: hypothetical protein QXT31_03060 [Candidatus Bathyarchaeia archaeon]
MVKHKHVKAKRKHRFKIFEILGFIGIGFFMALILYLAFAPIPNPSQNNVSTIVTKTTSPKSSKAAIVDQLGLRYPNQAFINEAKIILSQAGFQVDVYPPEAVTVNLYKTISSKAYSLIVFRVHMGIDDEAIDKPTGLFTNEPYNQFGYQFEQLKDWVSSAKAYSTNEVLFAISPKFIKEATVLDYPSTIIILSGCFGLYSKALPQAFIDRGASIVLGWDGLVSVNYVDEATLSLLKALCLEKLSVKEAVEAVMREIGPDPDNKSILGYYPLEKGKLKII